MIERLEALDIRKQYNSRFELACSFDATKGAVYTIAGPNGSGKSTLLRILSLIELPDSGKVIYYNDGASMLNPYKNIVIRRKVVLVPTRAGLFNETVFNNVAYGLKLRRTINSVIGDRVMETLEEVGLAGKEYRNALELSSGEAQRLALSRALVIDPDILFLDEPTASLDPDNTRVIEDIISEWRRKTNKIIVIVTHNLHQAKALSDIVIFMYKGKIIESSSVDSFFKKPSTELAQKFICGEVY